jgi:O-antigen/teichoic acid export membrane protein
VKKLAVAREIGIGVVVRAWTQVTAFVVVVIAARMLERQEFGIYAIASVFIIILSTIMYSGIYEYIIKTEDYEAAADTCYWINLGFALAGAIVIALLAPLVAALVRAPQIAPLMLCLAPTAIIAALTSWQEALVLRRKKITGYYIIWFCSETIAAGLAIALFFAGVRLYALVGYRYSQLIVSSVGYLLYMGDVPRLAWRTEQARHALAFASRLYGSRLIAIVTNYGADLIIGTLASPAAAGAYRLASRMIFGFSEIYFQPIKTIAWVRFSSAERAGSGLGHEWLGLMTVLSMIAWPTLGGAAVLSRQLTGTVLGNTWLAAAPVVVILALSKSGELFEVFLDPLLGTAGNTALLLRIRAGAAVVAIAGFLALAHLGPAFAAWAQAATYLSLAIVTIIVGLKRTNGTVRALITALLPGLATTALTMLAAAAASRLTGGAGWPLIAKFAADVAAGGFVWAFMAGIVFRRRTLGALLSLKDQAPPAAMPGPAAAHPLPR